MDSLRKKNDLSTASSEASLKQPDELEAEFEYLFARAADEIFEDGMETDFSSSLIELMNTHETAAIEILADLIMSENVDAEAASEALRWVGHIENLRTQGARRELLERCLFSPSARIRDGAVLGLASMDDPSLIHALQNAISRETVSQLRQDMQEVLEQLIETQLEKSPTGTTLASEEILRRDWDTEEEDSAWAHL